jgi:hypothetical protein
VPSFLSERARISEPVKSAIAVSSCLAAVVVGRRRREQRRRS